MATEEYIRRLYIEKIAGVITEEEDRWLQEQLLHDVESREIWQRLRTDGEKVDLMTFIDETEVEKDLTHIKGKMNNARDGRINKGLIRYAAAVALLLSTGIFLYHQFDSPSGTFSIVEQGNNVKAIGVEVKDRKVQLLVGDGEETLDLEQTKSTIAIAGTEVRKEDGTLIYEDVAYTAQKINTLIVPPTKDYKLVLADGTKVWLNSSSQLKFPMNFTGPLREVYLEGEAYFEIAQHKEKPFIVHTANTVVRVLGTKFNLMAYDQQETTTALVEGKVKMEILGGDVMELKPGYKGVYNGDGLLKESFDPNETLSWKEGVYYFRNKSLLEISYMVNRWFDLPVVFANDKLKSKTITGLLEKHDLNGFLNDVQATLGVRYRFDDEGIHLY